MGSLLPYEHGVRHPCMRQVGVQKGDTVVITARNPIDRWLSLQRFINRGASRIIDPDNVRDKLRQERHYRRPNNAMVVHLLHGSIDGLSTVEGVTLEVMRFENLAEDFAKAFPSAPPLEMSNHILKNPREDCPLTHRDVDLIKKLSPIEWDLYNCESDPRVRGL